MKYHGNATGASTTVARRAAAAPRTAAAPPARERHHSHVTRQARATQPAIRHAATAPAEPGRTTPAIFPSAVGIDSHGSSTEFPLSVRIQPRSTPATTVHSPNVATTMDTEDANTRKWPRAETLDRRAAHTHTRNGNATAAGALTAAASATNANPAPGAVVSTSAVPAASSPTISRSLCPPDTTHSTISGLATVIHSARSGRAPRWRHRTGKAKQSNPSPVIIASRVRRTPRSTFSPVTASTLFMIKICSGPYGEEMYSHPPAALSVIGEGSSAGTCVYGSRPACATAPCAR